MRKTPTRLKLVQGNPGRRPISEREPEPELGADPPGWLSPQALEHWPSIAEQLTEIGVLTRLDQVALALYCETFARWKDANERVVKHGSIVRLPNGFPIQSPYLAISSKAHGQLIKLLCEFGMTPAARTKVEAAKNPSKPNPLDKFLKVKRDDLPIDATALLTAIERLTASIEGLRTDLNASRAQPHDDPLLHALHAAIGSGVAFSCAELIERADDELLAVIGSDPIALGRELGKREGRGVRRIGRDASGTVWALM